MTPTKRTEKLPEPGIPNLLEDEEGAVMTEFVIVAPFLLAMMLMLFFFMDLNRFRAAATQMAGVQMWRGVSAGQYFDGGAGWEAGDGISVHDPSGTLPSGSGTIMGLATAGVALMTAPQVMAPSANIWSRGIYAIPDVASIGGAFGGGSATPFDVLGINKRNWDQRDFDPQSLGAPNSDLTYRNSDFLRPVNGALNAFVGRTDPASIEPPINITEVRYITRQSIIADPHSIYTGAKDAGNRRWLPYSKRFTPLRSPYHGGMAILQTAISGNITIFADIPQLVVDLWAGGATYGGSIFSMPVDVSSFFEQNQILRKVDEYSSPDHDFDGEIDWDGENILEHNRLEEVSDDNERWEMIQ